MKRFFRNFFRIVGIVIASAIVLAIAYFSVSYYINYRHEKAELISADAAYNKRRIDLTSERSNLKTQLRKIRTEIDNTAELPGISIILFTSPSEKILESAHGVVTGYGYLGVIAVSEDEYPGDEGCLSVDEVKKLVDDGWEICIYIKNNETDIISLKNRMISDGLPIPEAAYFYDVKLTDEWESKLSDASIKTIIKYNLDKMSFDDAKQLWLIPAWGSYDTNCKPRLSATMEADMSLALTIGYSLSIEQYSSSNISAMLNNINTYVTSGQAKVCTASEARDIFTESYSTRKIEEARRSGEIASINKRLDEIEKELADLIEEWSHIN